MHSRLTKCYNINGMDHLNVIFGSYRTTKQALLKLLQLPEVNVQDHMYVSVIESVLWFLLLYQLFICLFLYMLYCCCVVASILELLQMHNMPNDALCLPYESCQSMLGPEFPATAARAYSPAQMGQMIDLEPLSNVILGSRCYKPRGYDCK